jgi:hypothetical protein
VKVLVDGQALPDDEARAFWQRFSDWMEEHKGDLAGFAAKEGFASVHPGVQGGRPVLFVSKTAVQKPYGPVGDHGSPGGAGGSGKRHGGGIRRGGPPKFTGKKPR